MERSPWKANRFSDSREIPRILWNPKLITAFKSALHLSLSWASWIQSMPTYPTSWRSMLILSSHLSLGLPSGLFPSGFPTKTLYKPLLSPIRSTCPTHLILLDFITRKILGEEYRSLSYSLCSFLNSPLPKGTECKNKNCIIICFRSVCKWVEFKPPPPIKAQFL